MQILLRFSYKHPLASVLFIILCSVLLIPNAFDLKIDESSQSMMADTGEKLELYKDTVNTFSSDSVVVIYIEDENLFSVEKLNAVETLVDNLSNISCIEKIESLLSEPCIRDDDGFLNTAPLFDYFPESQEECDQIKEWALENPIFLKNFISTDGKKLAINLFLSKEEDLPLVQVSKEIESILAQSNESFDRVFQMGMPFTWQTVNEYLKQDLSKLIPISTGILLCMLMLMLRSVNGAALPIITAGTSVMWTYGFMGLVGIPLNILTLIVPSLIIVLGSTEDIHLLAEYEESLRKTKDRKKAILNMIDHVGTPLLLTAITTFLGFLSIAVNKIEMLRMFSYAAAFGLFVNPIITSLLTPVFLRYFGKRYKESTYATNEKSSKLLESFQAFILKNRKALIVSMVSLILMGGLLSLRVKVDNNMLGYFKPSTSIRSDFEDLHNNLSGAQTFFIRISTGLPETFKDPQSLEEIAHFQEAILATGKLDQSISIVNYLELINQEMNAGKTSYYKIPESKELISQYLLFLERDNIEPYVTADFSEINIVVRHAISSSSELSELIANCQIAAQKHINSHFKVQFTGENLLINEAAESLAIGQVKGILLLLAVVFVLMAIMFMNLKAAFLSLIPNLFPVAILFGFMALFDIRLNPGSCMVAAIAIGLAVDNTIHFMVRYNKEMKSLKDEILAIKSSLKGEVTPILVTSIALVLGFGSLSVSNFEPVALFGYLSAFVMLFALVADFCLTPILLSSVKLLTLWDMLNLNLQSQVVMKSELFHTLKFNQIKKTVLLGSIIKRKKGEFIYQEGEEGKSMFFVLEGNVRTFEGSTQEIEDNSFSFLMPSDVFGEMYLLDESFRNESAIAESDVKCVEFNQNDLKRLHKIYPYTASTLYKNIARILGNNLMVANLSNNAFKQQLNYEK